MFLAEKITRRGGGPEGREEIIRPGRSPALSFWGRLLVRDLLSMRGENDSGGGGGGGRGRRVALMATEEYCS